MADNCNDLLCSPWARYGRLERNRVICIHHMKRMFIETSEFHHRWIRVGLGEEDLRELQGYLLEHPSAGNTVQGTGGVRKLR